MNNRAFGGTIVAHHLRQADITHLFTLCGGHISPILVSARDVGIHVIDVRDEAAAVFAADAYARLSGRPGVAVVTAGPGLTNTITAVKNAQMAQSPVIIIGGATPTILKNRGSLQDIDQLSLMASLTKWQTSAATLPQLDTAMAKALRVCQEGVPGPVFIEAPIDILYPRQLVHDMYRAQAGLDRLPKPLSIAAHSALDVYLKRQELQPSFALPTNRMPAIRRSIRQILPGNDVYAVAAKLKKAKRPALVLGSQVLVNRTIEEAEVIAEAVKALGVPTWTGGMARGLLGGEHPSLFRHNRGRALAKADLVIVAGFPFDFRLNYGRGFARNAEIISANLSHHDLTMNRRPDVGLQQHPGDFLQALSVASDHVQRDDWFQFLRDGENDREDQIDQAADAVGDGVNPIAFFRKLDKRLQAGDLLVVDGGDFVATAAYTLKPRSPLSWLDPGVFGTLGVGGGFVVGAMSCRPGDRAWLIYGDGSCAYSLAEFDTCIRHGFAPVAVIGTDASWGQIAREQEDMLGSNIGTNLLATAYEKVAEGYGGVGIRVEQDGDVDAALNQAIAASTEGKPVCINLILAKSDFRKGSISM